MNQAKKPEDMNWSPFYYGCFAGLIPWITIIYYFSNYDNNEIPGFLYAILVLLIYFIYSLLNSYYTAHSLLICIASTNRLDNGMIVYIQSILEEGNVYFNISYMYGEKLY
jgi:hypothetical protein